MKELSIEEKAKCYDSMFERLKEMYNNNKTNVAARLICERYFPELKESEDEKIRKELIEQVVYIVPNNDEVDSEGDILPTYQKRIDKYLAWLEKQGEQILANSAKTCKDEQKSADEVKPKFHKGEWVVFNNRHDSVYQVEKIENYEYTLRYFLGGSMPLSFSHENMIRAWTIKDAKDGDVLVDEGNNIGIYKKIEDIYWDSYIFLRWDGKLRGFGGRHEQTNTHPATKDKRDQLEKAMADAGYTFDFKKKELKKIEPHPTEDRYMEGYLNGINDASKTLKPATWSEEDEELMKWSINNLTELKDRFGEEYGKVGDCINWLKSLKGRVQPQPKQGWSEEDENRMKKVMHILSLDGRISNAELQSIYDWLKSLRPQAQWKPSEEQMKALDRAQAELCSTEYNKPICDLIDILNKLREE